MSSFVYATTLPGLEPLLQTEVGRLRPDWRPAFRRPGFVTFKTPDSQDPGVNLGAVFPHAWGLSFGQRREIPEILADADAIRAVRLHVFDREDPDAPTGEWRAKLLEGGRFPEGEEARPGEIVLDVITSEGEPVMVGAHRHTAARSPWPGGSWRVKVPESAPDRAYRKLVEGVRWSGFPIRKGHRALEFGSTGGGTLALLERGVDVWAVDPEPLAASVKDFPGPASCTHLPFSIGGVPRDGLPEGVQWLVLDISVAPPVALRAIQRFFPPYKKTLLGALFTLKLNDAPMANRIPEFLDRMKRLGLKEVRATHLPGNRQEFFACGLTLRAGP